MMSGEKDKSPHYIPELDPANKKRPTDIGERLILWLQYLTIIFFILAGIYGVAGWFLGWPHAGLSLALAVSLGITITLTFIN